MKKLSFLILALLLTLSFSLTCYAKGGTVTVNGASAKVGSEVTVKITAEGLQNINAGSIEIISLPEGVTVVGGEWALSAYISDFNSSMKLGIFALDENEDIDGTVFKLKLKLEADAKSGDIVCELRFKDGSAGNADVAGVQNIPGKLIVLSSDAQNTDSENTGDNNADDDFASGDTEKDDKTDDVQEPHDKSDETDVNKDGSDDESKMSPVVIALIAVSGIALIAAIVLIITRKKR